WKAHTRSTGASPLLPDGQNSKKARGFGASVNREEAPVLPWRECEVRFRRMNLFSVDQEENRGCFQIMSRPKANGEYQPLS
ncbi:MAG: hypothetical protein ABIK89_26200, partial [Planctomycetota bacterium]